MIKGLIVNDGIDVNTIYDGEIVFAQHYVGTIYPLSPAAPSIVDAVIGNGLPNGTYYYSIVALANVNIIINNDTANQLSALILNCQIEQELFWTLRKNTVTNVITFTLCQDMNGQMVIAQGSRTGNGVINLVGQNDNYNISGQVTVAYTADSVSSNNTIYIAKNVEVGLATEEVSDTISVSGKGISLSWNAVSDVKEYRIYRGTTSGIYDGFMVTDTNSFIDDGHDILGYDFKRAKRLVNGISQEFIPQKLDEGNLIPAKSFVYFEFNRTDKDFALNLQTVTNQPTWNLNTAAATAQALKDINGWLAESSGLPQSTVVEPSTSTSGQTTITTTAPLTGSIMVVIQNVTLQSNQYSYTVGGNTITLVTPLTAGNAITVVIFNAP
jgi:hypothetical protein